MKPLGVRDLRALLATGPKSKEDILAAGYDIYELRARMKNLRDQLRPDGGTILRTPGPVPTWELVLPV